MTTKTKKVTVSDPMAGDTVQPMVGGAFHVYRREGEPDSMARSIGTRYRSEFGPNTLVFVHMHQYGEACVPSCRERVAEQEA